jgi:hypothetical protein
MTTIRANYVPDYTTSPVTYLGRAGSKTLQTNHSTPDEAIAQAQRFIEQLTEPLLTSARMRAAVQAVDDYLSAYRYVPEDYSTDDGTRFAYVDSHFTDAHLV